MSFALPSPLQEIPHPLARERGIRWIIKRDDLIHPLVSGNKYRKLKYTLQQATSEGCNTLVTLGGAHSNHLLAVAAAGREVGCSSRGYVRGEPVRPLNPTLAHATKLGMELHYLDRATFRHIRQEDHLPDFLQAIPRSYFIPEGGTNRHALPGCAELIPELEKQLSALPDFLTVACGTGGTFTGLLSGLPSSGPVKLVGFPVLKGGFMADTVRKQLRQWHPYSVTSWQMMDQYHFGGYARFDNRLIDFINEFHRRWDVPLDPVYTGKHFFGVLDKMQAGFFPTGSTVVSIHTGGLQGIQGFNRRYGPLIEAYG